MLAVLALTVTFFVVLLAIPSLTHNNGFWIPQTQVEQAHPDAEHK